MSWLAVAFGGALGAMMRYGVFIWLTPHPSKFPVATFAVNVCGCFMAGILYVAITHAAVPQAWRPLLAVGFLGAFTTFSTFSLEALLLWQNQLAAVAFFYVVVTLFSCLLAVWLGYLSSQFLFSQ
jgi:CrcB protein